MDFATAATLELSVSSGWLDSKERVKQAIDIVDLVGSHIQLRRQGRNYVGLCPWHDDTRPSLQVNPERQSFKCWVCDIGGDVFTFVMKIEGVEFREALQMLADRAGITIERPRRQATAGEPGQTAPDTAQHKRTLLQAMAWAEGWYHRCLLESAEAEPARQYLQQRGITAESIKRFHLGFSPLERDWILRQVKGEATAEKAARRAKILETIGILIQPADGGSPFDRFRGRLLFSIRDGQGRPVGIGGRVLPESKGDRSNLPERPEGCSAQIGPVPFTQRAKYINSPETPLFTKNKLLYGLDLARDAMRKTRTALVMEGYTDVIVAHQHGFTNAVAVLGTALGQSHIRLLKAHADRIILVLDGDEAGMKRANEVLELFVAQQADLRILTLPEGLDPCDFLQTRGAAALAELLETKVVDALDHAFQVATAGIDVEHDVHGASQAIERLLGIVAQAPRLSGETSGDARIREQKIIQRMAAKFRVDEQELRRRLSALRRRLAGRAPSAPAAGLQDTRSTTDKPIEAWERELLELLLARPDCIAAARRRIAPEKLAAGPGRSIYEVCCRLDDKNTLPSFERLMLEFDEPAVKSLLVELDERGRAKGLARADADVLLDGLTMAMHRKEAQRQRPAQIVALREGGLSVQEQAAMLEDIIRQKRGLD